MKYLIITLALILAGCSDNETPDHRLQSQLRESQMNLQSCQNSLEVYRGGNTSSGGTMQPDAPSEPETPAEPTCESVDYTTVYKDGHLLATCKQVETTACGVDASSCTDGYSYSCLTNVKMGSDTKKECN